MFVDLCVYSFLDWLAGQDEGNLFRPSCAPKDTSPASLAVSGQFDVLSEFVRHSDVELGRQSC